MDFLPIIESGLISILGTGSSEFIKAESYIHFTHKSIEKRKDMEYIEDIKRRDKFGPDVNETIKSIENNMQKELTNIANNQINLLNRVDDLSKSIKSNDLIEPRIEILKPTLDAIDIYGNEEVIRDMFASILSKSMDKNNFNAVRPSFVNMIKEFSPIDALVLKKINKDQGAIVKIINNIKDENGNIASYTNLFSNYVNIPIENASDEDIASSIDNLVRMNLIYISYDEHLVNYNYNEFKKSNLFRYIKDVNPTSNLDIQKGLYRTTYLGNQFKDIVFSED